MFPENTEPRRIILARHGQTEWNKGLKFQGTTNVQLTDEGKRQAETLARRLSTWPPDVIYTSPLDRAKFTAQTIAEKCNLSPIIVNELEEIYFGDWEGQSIKELQQNQYNNFSGWREDPFFNPPKNAETWDNLKTRLSKAVKIFLSGSHKKVVVVSHGGVMRALYAVILGLNPHRTWNMDVYNCAMTGIEIRNGHACLAFSNDNLHVILPSEKLPAWR